MVKKWRNSNCMLKNVEAVYDTKSDKHTEMTVEEIEKEFVSRKDIK